MKLHELRALVDAATAGPWRIGSQSETIITEDNRALGYEGGRSLASISGYPDSGFFPSPEEGVANTAAIVALRNHADALIAIAEGFKAFHECQVSDENAAYESLCDALARLESL